MVARRVLSGVHRMYEWYRQRGDDRWNKYILHEDWILGDEVQFSWRERSYWNKETEKYNEPVFELYVRRRQWYLGFGIGCSDWYFIDRTDDFSEMCKKINKIIDQDNKKYWLGVMNRVDENRIREKEQKLEQKFCGHGSKGAIGIGYDR